MYGYRRKYVKIIVNAFKYDLSLAQRLLENMIYKKYEINLKTRPRLILTNVCVFVVFYFIAIAMDADAMMMKRCHACIQRVLFARACIALRFLFLQSNTQAMPNISTSFIPLLTLQSAVTVVNDVQSFYIHGVDISSQRVSSPCLTLHQIHSFSYNTHHKFIKANA